MKRNYDQIKDLIPDYSDKLDSSCYWKTDTHINFIGGKEITFNILNHIDNNLKREDYDQLIKDQMNVSDEYTIVPECDLLSHWSYSKEELEEYRNEKQIYYCNKYSLNMNQRFLNNLNLILTEKLITVSMKSH